MIEIEKCTCGGIGGCHMPGCLKAYVDKYPDGNPKTAAGAKKPSFWLAPVSALLHLCSAFADGARKYGAFNWRTKGVTASVYTHAAGRHIAQWIDGEDYDPVSGVHHLAHAMACCAIILDAEECGKLNDDRPPAGTGPDMIRRFSEHGTFKKQT